MTIPVEFKTDMIKLKEMKKMAKALLSKCINKHSSMCYDLESDAHIIFGKSVSSKIASLRKAVASKDGPKKAALIVSKKESLKAAIEKASAKCDVAIEKCKEAKKKADLKEKEAKSKAKKAASKKAAPPAPKKKTTKTRKPKADAPASSFFWGGDLENDSDLELF